MTKAKSPPRPRAGATATRRPAKARISAKWRATFLAALADTSNVTAAAAAAGINPAHAYKIRRAEPAFAREWQAALCEGYDNLEMELLHRLRNGDEKAAADRKFDNATALRLLAVHRESAARERAIRDNTDATAVRASLDAKLEEMREQVMARRGRNGA